MADDQAPAGVSPTRGQIFTHSTFRRLLPDGTQGFALMKVTAVRRGEVFYTYADSPTNKGDWRMPIENWVKRYGTADN
ncbi:hypothetical protein MTY66_60750 (plasmid) [Mycolicibacterium sp. TY66]|jgi:hypothetical protein|uniref:hypothetical protein n=1 Tax=unclassified Mycolicibacterium TaxID=2636767 RepID=UPI001BB3A9FE|nr:MULTISPECIES: hypothetical protein [unclassified Mycolicibacterium]BCI84450.1 hypothetical protein MTY66_60750 [Mycolicibacterium sp. TY66]BCJ84682.1 hypothetical protein MTY81_60550 [Mycolicibacterium sp. TY81]